MLFTGCKDNNKSDDKQETVTTQEQPDSQIEDSLSDIDFIYWITVAISLTVAIIAIIKAAKVNNRASRHRKDINMLFQNIEILKDKIISNSATSRTYSQSRTSLYDYRELSDRISRIENYLKQTAHPVSPVINKTIAANQRENNTRKGYFRLPSQMSMTEAYFKQFDEIRDSDSRFTVEIRGEKAVFVPLLDSPKFLNGIKSGDLIKFALEFQGCSLSDAKQMKVMYAGEAINKDGLWIITKKALISLVN